MKLHLVSEARPIPWERLNEHEQKWIREADEWMKSVVEDAKRAKPTAGEIDQHKSGRVLFIDGPRGAGKTSLLLTLLEHWRNKPAQRDAEEATLDFEKLRVLLPILDFDPLPRGMPLHGWLLEPWRNVASKLDKDATSGADGKDLIEMWSDVFERVVLGWSQVAIEGKGVVEKALAYQEQASGWVDTHDRWCDLVNAAVCRIHKCSTKGCKAAHPYAFIIAIDDVDLQVEQVPYLIHAIRLLHHPNVVYVLTGHMEHLRFVVELDYIRQHSIRLGVAQCLNTQDAPDRRDAAEKIKSYSRTLRDALIEKAIPAHATLSLSELTFEQILKMRIDVDGRVKNVTDQFDGAWKPILEHEEAGKLPVATARRAQHAIDRHLRPISEGKDPRAVSFFADLCGASLDDQKPKEYLASLRGQLTTQLGPVLRTWEGDRLLIKLMEQAVFKFDPFDGDDVRLGADANRVAIAQLAVEKKLFKAPALDWRPVAGVLATEVEWKSGVPGITGYALFHWPWFNRPTVPEVLEFKQIAEDIRSATESASDRINLPDELLVKWLSQNISWQHKRKGTGAPAMKNLSAVALELKRLCDEKSTQDKSLSDEAQRWVREIAVMAAPYFGLPDGMAARLLREFEDQKLLENRKSVEDEERRIVEDAIIAGHEGTPGGRDRKNKGDEEPNSTQFNKAVEDFLTKRRAILDNHAWWKWKDAPRDPTGDGAPQPPEPVSNGPSAGENVTRGSGP